MAEILGIKLWNRRRKYPIKRDKYGRTARQQAFALFDSGKRPAEVAPLVGISTRTARRYFADWKKRREDLEFWYETAKTELRNDSSADLFVKTLADGLGVSEQEVKERLQKPWAIKQLVTGKWLKKIISGIVFGGRSIPSPYQRDDEGECKDISESQGTVFSFK